MLAVKFAYRTLESRNAGVSVRQNCIFLETVFLHYQSFVLDPETIKRSDIF